MIWVLGRLAFFLLLFFHSQVFGSDVTRRQFLQASGACLASLAAASASPFSPEIEKQIAEKTPLQLKSPGRLWNGSIPGHSVDRERHTWLVTPTLELVRNIHKQTLEFTNSPNPENNSNATDALSWVHMHASSALAHRQAGMTVLHPGIRFQLYHNVYRTHGRVTLQELNPEQSKALLHIDHSGGFRRSEDGLASSTSGDVVEKFLAKTVFQGQSPLAKTNEFFMNHFDEASPDWVPSQALIVATVEPLLKSEDLPHFRSWMKQHPLKIHRSVPTYGGIRHESDPLVLQFGKGIRLELVFYWESSDATGTWTWNTHLTGRTVALDPVSLEVSQWEINWFAHRLKDSSQNLRPRLVK